METNYTYEDFLDLPLGSLKDYLNIRGVSVTGRKIELVARAFSAYEFKLPTKLSAEQQIESIKSEYQSRLSRYTIKDPSASDIQWLDDMTKWPSVDLGKIFSFILLHKEFDATYIGKYKDEKAFSYWKSNFVDTVYYSKNNDDISVLKSKVTPSQRIRQDPHEVWVAVKSNGAIVCGWCTCIAGTSATCNHMIALLYKVNYAVQCGYNNLACTSVPCGWNRSTRKEVVPCKIMDLNLRRDKASKPQGDTVGIISKAWKNFDPRKEGQQDISEQKKKGFIDGLKNVAPNAQIFKSVESDRHSQPKKNLCMSNLVKDYCNGIEVEISDQDKMSGFMESLSLTDEDVSRIEKETKGQSSSYLWKEHRKGRITASNMKDVCAKVDALTRNRGDVKPKTTPLLSKLVHGSENLDHVPAIRWGKDNEDKAMRELHAVGLANHTNCKLSKSGLYVVKDKPYIGASPDGFMSCSCCGQAVLEIKCPYSIRESTVMESWSDTDFLEYSNGKIQLKRDHKYYHQVTGQMAVTGVHKCYFLVWTPKELHIEAMEFDPDFWLR